MSDDDELGEGEVVVVVGGAPSRVVGVEMVVLFSTEGWFLAGVY